MLNHLKDEIQIIYVMLGNTAGRDPIEDSQLSGRIKATKAIVEMAYEDIFDEESDDDQA